MDQKPLSDQVGRVANASTIFSLAAIFLCIPPSMASPQATTAVDPLDGQKCIGCHLAGDQTRIDNADHLSAPTAELCTNCHSGAEEASHPSGVTPSMVVPDYLPLDRIGQVTCSSCHYVHAPGHGQPRVVARGGEFCNACHEPGFFENMKDHGVSIIASGHLKSGTYLEAARTDEYSVQCMICHYDRGASGGDGLGGAILTGHSVGGSEHPVGVDYDKAYRFGGYRRVSELPDSIALPGGQVSCISCHNAYAETHGETTTSNERSNLCFQCHDL